MVSIIICSRTKNINTRLSENIKDTIGCDHELIVIDNSQNKYSIFEAYNLGMKKSKGELYCFLHDDIFFQSQNWGKIVQKIFFDDPLIGLVGIAGGKIKTRMPSAWWDGGENSVKIIQHYKNDYKDLWDIGFDQSNLQEVAAIDGVFMVMKKDLRINFDERLSGFHNYDLSISLLQKKYRKKIVVTSKILLEHFSEGNLDKTWYKSTSKFHRLYREFLPLYVVNSTYSSTEIKKKEVMIGNSYINKLIDESLLKEALYWWWQLFKLKPVSKFHFRILNKIISGK